MKVRRIKKSTQQAIFVGIISLIVIVAAFSIAFMLGLKQLRNTYNQKLSEYEQHLKNGYVAKETIKAGEQITLDNTIKQEVLSSVPMNEFINENDIGKIAVVDIDPQTHILKNMVAKDNVEDGLREEEFSMFYLNKNLQENDFIDLRIMYANGENYVVLSKKAVKNLDLANNDCFLWLNEEEILAISSAIVDAYIHPGTKLYTAKYIEPKIQDASIPNYQPNEDVINLIQTDPNVVREAIRNLSISVRKELESRLANIKTDVDWNAPLINEYVGESDNTVYDDPIQQSEDTNSPVDEGDIEYVE